MSGDDVKKYEVLQKRIENLKADKAGLLGQQKVAKENLLKIKEEMKAEGIESRDQLDKEISALDKEISTHVEKAEMEVTAAEAALEDINTRLSVI